LEQAQYKHNQLEALYESKDYQNLKLSYKIDPKKNYGVPREIKLEAKVRKNQALLENEEKRAQVLVADAKRHKGEMHRLIQEVNELRDELSTTKKKIRQARDPRRRLTDRIIATTIKPKNQRVK